MSLPDGQIRLMKDSPRSNAFTSSIRRGDLNNELLREFAPVDPADVSTSRRARTIAIIAEMISDYWWDKPDPVVKPTLETYEFGPNVIERRKRTVNRGGEQIRLTPREYELLLALAFADGAPLSRNEIAESVWGGPLSRHSRTIDQHIGQIRRKLEADPANPRYLITLPRFGYRLLGSWG